jgi:RNA polymerase sigma factor (sigma-70 family)
MYPANFGEKLMRLRSPLERPKFEKESNVHLYRLDHNLRILDLAELCGTSGGMICGLQSGMVSPVNTKGKKVNEIKAPVKKMMALFGCGFEDLFPRYACKLDQQTVLTDCQVARILYGNYQNHDLDLNMMMDKVEEAMATLPPREQKFIRMFFLECKTYKKCGDTFGVSVERARQITLRGMKRLREKLIIRPWRKKAC